MKKILLSIILLASTTANAKCFSYLITDLSVKMIPLEAKVISNEMLEPGECALELEYPSVTINGVSEDPRLCMKKVSSKILARVNTWCCHLDSCPEKGSKIWFTSE